MMKAWSLKIINSTIDIFSRRTNENGTDTSCVSENEMANKLINGASKIVIDICPVRERTIVLKYEKRKWIHSYVHMYVLEKVKK